MFKTSHKRIYDSRQTRIIVISNSFRHHVNSKVDDGQSDIKNLHSGPKNYNLTCIKM